MSARTVGWTAPGTPDGDPAGPAKTEGLRERKKRLMRQQLSDTATEMFVERGFDAVRVAEVAEACGVSEKTVFNYFPTKESLVMDRFDTTMDSLRTGLAEPGVGPVQAALRILAGELNGMVSWLESQQNRAETISKVQRFTDLIQSTPSLRAYQRDVRDQLIDVAADALATRAGIAADAPEVRIAAIALLGLWEIHFRGMRQHLVDTRTPAEVRDAVTADVERAAQLIEAGLSSFEPFARGQ